MSSRDVEAKELQLNLDQTSAKQSTFTSAAVFDKTRPSKSRSVRHKSRRSPYQPSTVSSLSKAAVGAAGAVSCDYSVHDYADRSSPLYDYHSSTVPVSYEPNPARLHQGTTSASHDCLDTRYFYPQSHAANHPGLYYDQSPVIGIYSYPAAAAAAYQRYYDENVPHYRSAHFDEKFSQSTPEADYLTTPGSDVSSTMRRLQYNSSSPANAVGTTTTRSQSSSHPENLSANQDRTIAAAAAAATLNIYSDSCAKTSKRLSSAESNPVGVKHFPSVSAYNSKTYASDARSPETNYFAKPVTSSESSKAMAPSGEDYDQRRAAAAAIRQVAMQSVSLRRDCAQTRSTEERTSGERKSVLRTSADGDRVIQTPEMTTSTAICHPGLVVTEPSIRQSVINDAAGVTVGTAIAQPSVIMRRTYGAGQSDDMLGASRREPDPVDDDSCSPDGGGDLTPPGLQQDYYLLQKSGYHYRSHQDKPGLGQSGAYYPFSYAANKFCSAQGSVGGASGGVGVDQRYNSSNQPPGYTSVIVDAQQFYVANGYVH